MCTESLHINGRYASIFDLLNRCLAMLCHPRYTAPSLRLFVPNSLTLHFFRGLCLQQLWPVSSFFLWLGFFRDDHSITTTSAPSSRPDRPERLADKLSFSPIYCNHPKHSSLIFHSTQSSSVFCHSVSLFLCLWGPVLLHYQLPFYLQFLFTFRRGSTPPQVPLHDSSYPAGSPSARFTISSREVFQ
jgi:hypothetical protein